MLVNLTPHAITIRLGEVDLCIESSGIARAEQRQEPAGLIDGFVPLVRMSYGDPVGLPDPQEGTYLIVSALTVEAARRSGRTTDDLLLTADLVRDDDGRIIACRALAKPC